jgi:regulator of nucleoside diphosphate kinase
MSERRIYITEFDKSRLEKLIAAADEFGDNERTDLTSLAGELDRAEVVPSKDVPPDLVFPGDANIDAGAISVLAPVGTAILGYAKGDVIEWLVPSGIRRIVIEEVLYQPEAEGDFHL